VNFSIFFSTSPNTAQAIRFRVLVLPSPTRTTSPCRDPAGKEGNVAENSAKTPGTQYLITDSPLHELPA
jgi:hypothetical protein